jgi:cysteine desulfurase
VRRIYLDANATTPLLPEVLEAMRPFLLERFGNASSIHQEGQQARSAVEQARASVARLLNCRPAEIVFTGGGTESDNLAIFGSLVTGSVTMGPINEGDHVISSPVEHHAVLHAVQRLKDRGAEVTLLPVNAEGVVTPKAVREALRPNTRLISIMAANNETGVLQPVAAIGQIAAEAGVRFHVDAVQAAGRIPLDVEAIGCHLLTISGHKMHAPQGTGVLFVRRGTRLEPLSAGGAHERQRRAGTENVAGIVGLGQAAECAMEELSDGAGERMAWLRDRLEAGLLQSIPACGVNGGRVQRAPNTTNFWFDQVEGESLVIALDLKGLAVSSGAACSSGANEPSHVLLAMGLSGERARSSLRFSLHRRTTEDEIDETIELVSSQVARLRQLSAMAVRA